jgi:hypothetical protein
MKNLPLNFLFFNLLIPYIKNKPKPHPNSSRKLVEQACQLLRKVDFLTRLATDVQATPQRRAAQERRHWRHNHNQQFPWWGSPLLRPFPRQQNLC